MSIHAPTSRPNGFTLVELMVTLVVLSVFLGLAVPSFRGLLDAQRLKAMAYDMVADLSLARSEALKRGSDITLTPQQTGDWTAGWTLTVGTEVVAQRAGAGSSVRVVQAPATVTFDRNGRVANATAVTRFGLEDRQAHNYRCISLDPSGRPKSVLSPCPTP